MSIVIAYPTIAEERPLELLFACHDKVRRFTALAGKLSGHVAQHGADEEAREAAASILRYFELALPHHHADEEEDVFPALRHLQDIELNRAIDTLLAEHVALDLMWQEVRPWLNRIAQGETPASTPVVLPRFVIDYPFHAAREEREVFTAIKRLPTAVLDLIAQRMRARRGA